MATKKGSKVRKETTRELRLEVLKGKAWAPLASGAADEEGRAWVKQVATALQKGPLKWRLIERTVTTRIQSSDTIIEGEGKET